MAKPRNNRKPDDTLIAGATSDPAARTGLTPDEHPAVALLDKFVEDTDYEIDVVWPDASLVTCVYLRVNGCMLDHDHLLRGSHRYPLRSPYKGKYAVEWAVAPEVPIKGTLLVGIVNLRAKTKLVVDSIENPGRAEWSGDKVVDAP